MVTRPSTHLGDRTSARQRTASDDCQTGRSFRRLPQFSTTLAEMALDSRASPLMNLSTELEEGDATLTRTTELLQNGGAAIIAAATNELIREGY